MDNVKLFMTIVMVLFTNIYSAFAQVEYPDDIPNSRFFTDYHSANIVRPALSLRGFDSENHWQNTSALHYGYGLKQIIDNYLNPEVSDVLSKIAFSADNNTITPTGEVKDKVKVINANADIIQSKAFMALLGYVLERNGLNYNSVGISTIYSPRQYLDQLTYELLNPKGNLLTGMELVDETFGDTFLGDVEPIHTLNSTTAIARALDLYLAIENAYKFYADENMENDDFYYCDMPGEPACSTNWPLFTKSEKTTTLNRIANAASILYDLNKSDLRDVSNEVVPVAIRAALSVIFSPLAIITSIIADDIDIEETQPGNWSYKQYLAAGYTALGMQTGAGLTHTADFGNWFNKAFKTTFKVAGTDRTAYFGYQTDDGKEYWAEGQLYFRITLRELIPFIHAVRGNQFWKNNDPSTGILSNGIYERSDPFFSSWFTNSLNWLAETATPDGRTAPLDDSKKQPIAESSVLRWSSVYGNGTIGNKFAAVNNSLSQSNATTSAPNDIFEADVYVTKSFGQSGPSYGSVGGLRVVELAIPRNTSSGTDFYSNTNDYTNPGGSVMSGASKQSTVVRRQINGKKHFILMNGEYGDAIGRGEGHEQPDQLQLLYYIDDQSYLMDSGYDSGNLNENSTWNHIKHHNLPAYMPNTHQTSGGESPPINGWWNDHSVKHSTWDLVARKVAKQNNVVKNYSEKHGNITLLHGEKRLGFFNWVNLQYDEYRSKHFRNVLFIEDPAFPYLIDFNTTYRIKEYYDSYFMSYHFKGSKSVENNWVVSNYNGNKVTGFLDAVEFNKETVYPLTNYWTNNVLVEESDTNEYATNVALLSNGSKYFSTVGIIHGNGTTSQAVPQKVFATGLNYQAWYWSPSTDIIDVIIKRTEWDDPDFSTPITFDVALQGEYIYGITLRESRDYGYARFEKINGSWRIVSDYYLNLKQAIYYTSSETISSFNYPEGSKIYISDNVTLTFTGTVTLDRAEIFLGENAKIEVKNGGNLTASYSEFKRLDPAKRFKGIILYTNNNVFNYVTVDGAEYGINSQGSDNHLIKNSEFRNNLNGIFLANSDNVTLDGNKMLNNAWNGIALYNSEVTITSSDYENGVSGLPLLNQSTISQNTDNGIDAVVYSKVWLNYSSITNNGSYNVFLDNTSRVYAGDYNITSRGFNKFDSPSSSDKYIYSLAMTTTGENSTSWTVPARNNYWKDGTAPSSSYFYGSVDYNDHLTEDPTIWNPLECGPLFNPTDCTTENNAPVPVYSSVHVDAMRTGGVSSTEIDKTLKFKERLEALKSEISANENVFEQARWLKTYKDVVEEVRPEYSKLERLFLRQQRNKWISRFHAQNALSADSLLDMDQDFLSSSTNDLLDEDQVSGQLEFIQASQIVGEAAILLEVEDAINAEKFTRVRQLYDKYSPYVQNKDTRLAFLQALVLMYEHKAEYGKAVGAIEQIEQMQPDFDMQEDWLPVDMLYIKDQFLRLAKEKEQSVIFEKNLPGSRDERNTLPDNFSVSSAYPNPFNPSTNISFDLPSSSKVRIEVFDITGRLVSVLTNQVYEAGSHQVVFNAKGLATGTYIVKANLAGTVKTQTITLVK